MIDAAATTLVSMRRRYRHARTVSALRRASQNGRREALRVVHMLHVGKTGGTAVQASLTEAVLPADLRLLLHGHGISLSDVPAEDDVFLFLREPVARFVSGFEMRRREGRPRHYRPWTSAERRAFARFESAETLAGALGSTDGSQRAEAERAMRSIYHVRSHLADWLVADELVRSRAPHLIFVGWQERLDADFSALAGLLGVPPTTSLPGDGYAANRATTDEPSDPLSAEASEVIRAWYAEDYRYIALLADLGLTEPPAEVRAALAVS